MAKQQYGTRKKYHYIYKTTNLLSGRYYLGMHSTDNLNDGYMGSGKRIKASIKKHGINNHKFEILEFFNTREKLASREKELVTMKEVVNKECMNLKVGGTGGWPPTAKQRFIEKMKDVDFKKMFGQKISNSNKRQFEEGKRERKYFYDWNGKKHKPETVEKIKAAKAEQGSGSSNSQFESFWITNGVENKKLKKGDPIPQDWVKGRKMK